MPGSILHVQQLVTCPHGARIQTAPAQGRVLVNGLAVATLADVVTVMPGCTYTVPGPKAQPCAKVLWTVPAGRVKVLGVAVLVATSVATCQSAEQLPPVPPTPKRLPPQPRVTAL